MQSKTFELEKDVKINQLNALKVNLSDLNVLRGMLIVLRWFREGLRAKLRKS